MADQAGSSTGSPQGASPWDEPLPENTQTKKSAPTIVGDLDVNKNQRSSAEPDKPLELKIPSDTDEKVGIKVDANKIASAPAAEKINPPDSTSSPQVDSTSSPQVDSAKPKASPPVSPSTPTKPAGSGSVDFWQSVYGVQPENPVAATKPETVPGKIQPATTPPPQPQPATPTPAKPAAAAPVVKPDIAPIVPTSAAPQVPLKPPTATSAAGGSQTPKPADNRLRTAIIAVLVGLIVLFAGGVFLTEEGLVSFGLEKIYGALHLEALWGGLPANAENAFAMSAAAMKSEKSFKISGSATLTVNKNVKSKIISPLVSVAALPIVTLKDEQIGPKIPALLAVASDLAGNDLFQDDSSLTTDLPADNQSQSTTSTPTSSTSNVGTSTSTNSTTDVVSVEELTTNINATIGQSVSGSKISIKSSKSPSSEVQLVYSKNKLYLKTSSDIIYDSQTKNSWIAFDLAKFGADGPTQSLLGSNFSGSNFSIVGSRGASQTINGVRCFHYSGRANLGNALESFGLGENSLTSLDFDYWLGAKDHLIHRLSMKIIPASASAVSRIDLSLDFSDFGSDSSEFVVPATSTPYSGSTSSTTSTSNQSTSTEKTRDAERKTDLANIAKALESYHATKNNYPKVTGTEKISASSGTLFSALVPTYLNSIPLDPSSPTYYYGYKSDGVSYELSAVLEDKTDPAGKTVGSSYLYFLSSL